MDFSRSFELVSTTITSSAAVGSGFESGPSFASMLKVFELRLRLSYQRARLRMRRLRAFSRGKAHPGSASAAWVTYDLIRAMEQPRHPVTIL